MYQYIATVYQSIRQSQEVKKLRKGLKKKDPTKELTIQQQEFWLPGSYKQSEKGQWNKKGN